MHGNYDVTSLGATMLRLSVPSGERLETASSFDVRTAGSESNTLVALSRMGKSTAWFSRLTSNAIGCRIANELRGYGVDTSEVIWTESDRNELFFVEFGAKPRPVQVTYDRANSSVSNMTRSEIPIDSLLNTRILHLTGILPALSPSCADTMLYVMEAAKERGVKISFDVNYRARLWSVEQAEEILSPMMRMADVLMVTREDSKHLLDIDGSPENIASAIHNEYGAELCVITLGEDGGIAFDGAEYYRCRGYDVQVIDRLGAGDCFGAGVLCGLLEGSVERGMNYASAMSAIKLGIHGDYFVSDRQEIECLLDSANNREVGR